MKVKRLKAALGANLAIFCAVAVLIIGILGVSIYVGLQSLVQNEIQKAASTSAMAGAAALYVVSTQGVPLLNAGNAQGVATKTFQTIVQNSSSLKGLGARLNGVSTSGNTVTVTGSGIFATPLLGIIGINQVKINASGTAMALKYQAAGPNNAGLQKLVLLPNGTMQSMQVMLDLAFPLVDNLGSQDIYILQNQPMEYAVEACNSTECYDLVANGAATPINGGQVKPSPWSSSDFIITGSCVIDLMKANVNKASKLRITHGNLFAYTTGNNPPVHLPLQPIPLVLDEIDLFGYAGACPGVGKCIPPAGFAPMP